MVGKGRERGLLEGVVVENVHVPELVIDLLGTHILVEEEMSGQLIERGGGEILVEHQPDLVHLVRHARESLDLLLQSV